MLLEYLRLTTDAVKGFSPDGQAGGVKHKPTDKTLNLEFDHASSLRG